MIWWMVRIIMEKKAQALTTFLFSILRWIGKEVDRKGVRTARVRCLSIWWWANA